MREGNAVGASVDGNGHIVQVGKGISFLGIDVNAYCVWLAGFYFVVFVTEHISMLAPVLEPPDGSDLINSRIRCWREVQRLADHGYVKGQRHLVYLVLRQRRCRQHANYHYHSQQYTQDLFCCLVFHLFFLLNQSVSITPSR